MVLLLTVVSTTVAQRFAPKARQPIHEPRRLDWDEHVKDLRRRRLFRRMYRMDEHSFDKLADHLRPIIERNDFYASEREPQSVRVSVCARERQINRGYRNTWVSGCTAVAQAAGAF